jgi:hypothetical protein
VSLALQPELEFVLQAAQSELRTAGSFCIASLTTLASAGVAASSLRLVQAPYLGVSCRASNVTQRALFGSRIELMEPDEDFT